MPTSSTIAWGDAGSSAGTVTVTAGTCSIAGTHTYAEEGSYTTTVTNRFASGGQSSDTGSALVADAPLNANSGSAVSAVAGQAFTATVATFSDPAPESLSSYSASIAWGDGQTSSGSIASGFAVSGSHTYANGGAYAITVTIHDEGGASATAVDAATVSGCTTAAPSTPSPPFDPPASDLNARYVQALYHDVLGRAPGPAEIAVATSALAHGLARAQLVQALLAGSEYRGDLATGVYQRLLGVPPDPTTKQFLIGVLAGGGSDEELLSAVAASGAYFQQRANSSNDGFLTALYCDVVYRPIDQQTQHVDDSALGSGTTRTQIAAALTTSSEFLQQAVGGYYLRFLRHAGSAPDVNFWVASIHGGGSDEKLIAALLSSEAYYREFNPAVDVATTLSPRGTIHTSVGQNAVLKLTVLRFPGKREFSAGAVVAPRTRVVGVVDFGTHRKGRVTLRWNRKVHGKRLTRGKYVALLRAYHRRKLISISDALPFRIR